MGLVTFRVPSVIKNCRKAVPIQIKTRNFGGDTVTGSITLYKDGEAVMTWARVTFYALENVNKIYHYNPRTEDGETIKWTVVVDVPNDPNISNNASLIMTMFVAECKEKRGKHNNERGNDD